MQNTVAYIVLEGSELQNERG